MTTHRTGAVPGMDLHELTLKGCKVHKLAGQPGDLPVSLGRRDFYKMGLVNGDMTITHGDKLVNVRGTVLFFVNPRVPHGVVHRSRTTTGYACMFTAPFFSGRERSALLKNSPLMRAGDSPQIPLNRSQAAFFASIFKQMLAVHNGDYPYKSELVRNCIELILRDALRIQPPQDLNPFRNGATRITHLFFDLLERQFPVEQSGQPLALRTPHDFANGLAVHVNYLNRALKEVTGKPTSAHIAERIIAEAKALLQHSDCSISEIAYALGFEYPTYFDNYFKRITGRTPGSFRK